MKSTMVSLFFFVLLMASCGTKPEPAPAPAPKAQSDTVPNRTACGCAQADRREVKEAKRTRSPPWIWCTGQLTTRLLEQPARSNAKTGHSKQRRLQTAFVAHLQDIARMYPASACPEVVLTIDNAPWHRGAGVEHVWEVSPHLRLYRLPSYSPQLNVIERVWRGLRRRATHNRLFMSRAS